MNPELKELLDEARSRGASMKEIRSIMDEYYGLKKKEPSEQIARPLIATFPSTSEEDSLGTKQSSTLGGGEEPTLSDVLQRPLIGNKRVPQYEADALDLLAYNFSNS